MHSGPGKKEGYETIVKAFIDRGGGVWEQIEGTVALYYNNLRVYTIINNIMALPLFLSDIRT
jgi:hypothetical protein